MTRNTRRELSGGVLEFGVIGSGELVSTRSRPQEFGIQYSVIGNQKSAPRPGGGISGRGAFPRGGTAYA